jgi:hypothetical protein
MIFPTLYSRTSTGATQQWTVYVEGDAFYTISGQVGGKMTQSLPNRCIPMNIGKANVTTGESQAILEAEAKHAKKLKSNYFENIDEIDTAWLECQLCEKYTKYEEKVKWPQVVDLKLNGTCCIVTKGEARTRTNEVYHAIPHITDALKKVMEQNPAIYIHGELYNAQHVNELNKITELVSVVRKPKDITPDLLEKSKEIVQYHVYDGYGFTHKGKFYGKETPFLERRTALYELLNGVSHFIFKGKFKLCKTKEEMEEYFNDYVAKGGEGVVIKNPLGSYEHKRSRNCLKKKKFETEEFEIVTFVEGAGNWAGTVKAVICKLPKNTDPKYATFKSNVKGTREHLTDLWNRRAEFENKGKMITVEFQEFSPYGVPLIPYTDLLVRDYEG